MKSIKGPAIFLAQFAGDEAPFNTFDSICGWAASLGYKGVQIPTWDSRFIDLKKAAESVGYCQELIGTAKKNGVEITELATHLQGQLVAVNPVYDEAFDAFAAKHVRGNPKARQQWATEQVTLAAKASRNMGLNAQVTFSGALAWPFLYPWPPRPRRHDRGRLRRTRPALEADPGRATRNRASTSASNCIRARTCSTASTFERFLDKLRRPQALLHQLRPVAFPAAGARLCRLHRRLSRADQGVSRQGRRVPSVPETGRLFGLLRLAAPRRAVPLARRRRRRFWRDFLQPFRLRLRQLGGARVGMRDQEP